MARLVLFLTIIVFSFAQTAHADFVDINMAGWNNLGNFGIAGNSETRINLGAGSVVTGVEFIDLRFEAFGGSWISDLALSVNNADASLFWDWRPGNDTTSNAIKNAAGIYGPRTGSFGLVAGITANGSLVSGTGSSPGNVLLASGELWATVYDPFPKDNTALEATISSGTLRVTFTAVPEPSTILLIGSALSAVVLVSRRRLTNRPN